MKRLLPLYLAALLTVLVGCEITSERPRRGPSSERAADDQQLKLLQKIVEYQEKTGVKLETLAEEAERQRALAEAASGPAPVVKDLQAAESVLSEAAQAAEGKQEQETAGALQRLGNLVTAMRAELPAAVISQHVERAMAALRVYEPRLHDASTELLAAYVAGTRNTTPRLVPHDVLEVIELAKKHVDSARATEAIAVLESVLAKCSQESVTRLLARAGEGIAGAQDALQREAWPVVRAELLEVDRLLGEVSPLLPQTAPPAAPAAAEESEAEAEATPAAEEESVTEASAGEETTEESARGEEREAPEETPEE